MTFSLIANPIPKQWVSVWLQCRITFLFIILSSPMMNANPDDWYSSDRITAEEEMGQMSCLGHVQVSLDQIGQARLTPRMFLTDTVSNPGKYKAFLMSNGATVVTCRDIGKKLQVTVFDTITRQSCWSNLSVEDKLMPQIRCAGDTVSCTEDPFTLDYRRFVTITDNCDTDVSAFYDIQIERLNCSHPRFSAIVHLKWTAVDDYMNVSTCVQDIYFRKAPIDSVLFPADDTLYCPNADLSLAGVPTVFGDTVSHLCSLVATFRDDTIAVCGGMYKVSRLWSVVDWCAMAMRRDTQLITVSDTTRPDIRCPRDTTIFAGSRSCQATYAIPAVTATDACSPAFAILFGVRVDSSYHTRPGQVIQLGLGQHTLEYIAIDPCGNADTCLSRVRVLDRVAPTIVCPPRLVVSIDARGTVTLTARHLANLGYIFDNCGLDTVLIKRMSSDCGRPQDTIFRDAVEFCCADDGTIEMVSLIAIDKSGNANQCMIEIEVQNKNMVTRMCPANITISCLQDYRDLNLTGQLVLVTSCSTSLVISHRDSLVSFDSCREGRVVRKFYAEFPNGQIDSSCRQEIRISNPYRLNQADILWPRDTTIDACRNQSPDSLGRPRVPQDVCSSVFISFTDSPITTRSDSCRTYNRNWRVRQTCAPAQTFTHTQVIVLRNFVPPLLVAPPDIIRNTRQDSCSRFVNVVATLTDRCNTNVRVSNDFNSGGLNASGVYPVGRTRVIFTAEDGCNQIVRDTVFVEVIDAIAPDADCEIIDTVMPAGGQIKLRPLDFLSFFKDNCTPDDKLRFSFSVSNFGDTCRIVTCDSLNTDPDTLRWRVFVFDSSGNAGFCNGTLVVRDPNNVCPGLLRRGTVSGLVHTPGGKGMPGVVLHLSGVNKTAICDDKGFYDFGILETNKPYVLTPYYQSDDWAEELTTEDIVCIQRHILDLESFHNPWMYIAADLDKNGRITAIDIKWLRQLILGKIQGMNGQNSWSFVYSDFNFSNPNNPLGDAPKGGYVFNGFWRNARVNFTAIKMGDLTGAAGVNRLNARIREIALQTQARWVEAQKTFDVDLRLGDGVEVSGLQLGFSLNELELVGIYEYFTAEQPTALPAEYFHQSDGRLMISYNRSESKRMDAGQNILRLTLKSRRACNLHDVLQLDGSRVSEIYPERGMPLTVRMRYTMGSSETETVKIKDWRIEPNPFKQACYVGFYADKESLGTMNVYDMQGKMVFSAWTKVSKGYNTWVVEHRDLPGAGTYVLRAEIGGVKKAEKLIFIP